MDDTSVFGGGTGLVDAERLGPEGGREAESIESLRGEVLSLSEELARTYEELALLHEVAKNLRVSRDLDAVARLVLEGLVEATGAEGVALVLEGEREARCGYEPECEVRTVACGAIAREAAELRRLLRALQEAGHLPGAASGGGGEEDEGDGGPSVPGRPFVCNHLERMAWRGAAPGVQHLVVVPLAARRRVLGWLLAFNGRSGGEFGTVEASLMASMATILGTHAHNLALWHRHEDLLVAVVRALVNAIDAKDPYTCGHSERVAKVACEIGRGMSLSRKQLRVLFLSGLLHDIGKIGIDDSILRKPGALTAEEFAHVKEHPVIGYRILEELRELREVLPGVRWHHERFDGKGYPDGLGGEGIPLVARILAVADAYDAMGSHRPYRRQLQASVIDAIFREGAGQQWDARVVEAFFRCREAVEAAAGEAE